MLLVQGACRGFAKKAAGYAWDMDPLRGENRPRVPYLVGAIPFGVMVLLLTWDLLPLADFTMDARGKAQWTGFALLAIGFAAVADRRAKKAESGDDSEPLRLAGVEMRTLTHEEIATIPKAAFVVAFVVPLATFLILGDSWIAVPLVLAIGALLGLLIARHAQQRTD